jgi:3'(2'), 5'-bisphosphate nucleotidase
LSESKSSSSLNELYYIALQAAIDASHEIMRVYQDDFSNVLKSDGSPVTEADLAASTIISSYLEKTNIPILGEETVHQSFEERKSWLLNWCVDPLDGTKEFIKRNGEFAVNIALIENQNPIFGLIASPVRQEILMGGKEMGAFMLRFEDIQFPEKWTKITAEEVINSPLVLTSSRSHHSGISLDFVNQLKANFGEIEFITRGSSMKFFDLALGKADVYPRFAPTMEWDIASGQAILESLGGCVIDAHTKLPLKYNRENITNPHFIAKTASFLREEKMYSQS